MNESEILISKEQYDKLIADENIPKEFCDIFEKEAKLEQYYSVTEAKLINCNIMRKNLPKLYPCCVITLRPPNIIKLV